MATLATTALKGAVKWAIKRISNLRHNKGDVPNGVYLLTGYKDVVAASYDVAGDVIELFEFPPQTYLIGASVSCSEDYDVGGTALRTDLVLSTDSDTSYTSDAGGAFVLAGQPQNDGISVVSSSAADTTQTVTIIGTTQGTDTVVVETVTLNGTNEVDTTKTDWGFVLGVKLSASCAGTVTIEEKSGSVDIITIATGVLSKGVTTVSPVMQNLGHLLEIVASGATTKMVGFKGTDENGNVVYDAQALNGTTAVESNVAFGTVTEIYVGDLESTRTITVSQADHTLVNASAAWTTVPPTPINFTGGALDASGFCEDVSNSLLAIKIDTAPTTANTGTVRINYKVLVYHGVASTVVP